MEKPSPCTGVCTLGDGGVCLGCGRSIEEIAAWPDATAEEREAIRRRAALRRAAAA